MGVIGFLLILASLGIALAAPLGFLGVALHRVKVVKLNWKPVFVKAVVATLIWAALSFVMLWFDFIFVYASAHTPPGTGVGVRPLITLLAAVLGYGSAGWALSYWVGRGETGAAYKLNLT